MKLACAGWHAGRDIEEDVLRWASQLQASDGFELLPCAKAVLKEFGGLHFELRGAGKEKAREPFALHPLLAEGAKERLAAFSKVVGERLYPLGEARGGKALLAIGEDGCVLMIEERAWLLGRSIDEALHCLIEGTLPPVVDAPHAPAVPR